MVIEPRYDNVRDFAFGISIVTKNEKQGIINTVGEELAEIKYDQIYSNQAGKVYHLNEGRYTTWTGLRSSKSGRPTFTIIENKRIRISSTGENTALAFTYINSDHRGGLMDYDGNMVIPFDYNDIMSEKYGMSAVRKGDFWGVVNLQNEVVIPIVHALADVAGPDLFIVTQEIDSTTFLSGLINRKGEAITPKEYSRIYQLNENLFSVYKGEQMGIIDSKGNIIVPLIQLPESYRLYQGWQQGLIEVSSTRGWPYSFINPEGKLIESTYKPMGFIDRYGRVYFKDKPFEKR